MDIISLEQIIAEDNPPQIPVNTFFVFPYFRWWERVVIHLNWYSVYFLSDKNFKKIMKLVQEAYAGLDNLFIDEAPFIRKE